ncbi:MFS general substrate transporter [Choiromyces venosus 120613-1]|uniref:MFS general substrate transporter n=1 Tax=Choiromyces venosus 120613-1 TaxID=1336337 RepID=A0A3N4K4G6_9PEZI|nr:MFS general substrate transporter [Choiromyces venosus 120613-1]
MQLESLRRQETLQKLRTVYSRQAEKLGELDAPGDASEFKDIDKELVTWDGPEDPENPRNFASAKKWRITLIVSLYTFVSPFASSIAAPAAQAYAVEFGITNSTIASMTVSIFLIGFALGPLFMAPLSELFGRVIVMQVTTILFLTFNIACAVANSTTQMIVFRLLAGLAGSAPLALGGGILSDIWAPVDLARAMAFFALGPLLGPVCAPIIAGFVVQNADWRWVFWILVIVCGVTMVIGMIVFREETYAVIILNRKAARLRKETGNENLHTVFEVTEDIKTGFWIAITRPVKMLVMNPVLLMLGLFMAFVYGFLYLMFVTFPILFQGEYGQTPGIAGLNYLGPGVGFMVGLAAFTPLLQKIYLRLTAANNGVAKPEFRLPILLFGGVLVTAGLFWYGWSAEKKLHWIMPLIGTSIFGAGMIPVFSAVQTYLIDMSPRYAASAVSAATLFRSLFGFAFPLFGRQMYDKLGYGWGNSLMGFIALPLGILFPLFIYKYGEPLRISAERRMEESDAKVRARALARSSPSLSLP